MDRKFPRSPYDREGGLLYFPRMLDKIRMMRRAELPADYHANLGRGFDECCCDFLQVRYRDLADQAAEGRPDSEVLDWAFAHGRRPKEMELFIWNEFMRKCGWRDDYSERLRVRLEGLGMADRGDVQTMFDLIEVDEGRAPGGAAATGA